MTEPEREHVVTVSDELAGQHDMPIWQYLTLNKFISMLENGGPWFSRVDRFPDIHEMAIARSALDWSTGDIENYVENQTGATVSATGSRDLTDLVEAQLMLALRENLLASCWHMSEVESGAMWAIYGRDGVAIQSSIRSLANALFGTGHTIDIFPLHYVDHATDDLPIDQPFRFKHKLYAYEQELRALLIPPDLGPSSHGFPIPVSLPSMIHAVHMPPGASGMHRNVVEAVLHKYHLPDIPIVSSAADTIPPYRAGVHVMLHRLNRESFKNIADEIQLKILRDQSGQAD